MRSSSFYSIVGLVLCVGASLAGCGGDDDDDSGAPPPARTSGEGQSCTSAADCSSNLVCVNLTCVKSGGGSAGETGSGGTGGSTGGSGGSSGKGGSAGTAPGKGGSAGTAPAPVLGGEGESCTKRADCEADLHCYNLRCTAGDSTGAAGGGGMGSVITPPVPVLGEEGETCVLPSDCAPGLTCIPEKSDPPVGVGVCGVADTGITPSGKSCTGECATAADCCQIPVALQEDTTKSCADLAEKLDGVDCDDPGASASLCFVQATYCTCDKTWACTNSMCVYKPACSADGLTTEGCPTYTRAGRSLPATCVDEKCGGYPAPTGCEVDLDCEDGPVSDDPYDTCSPDECTCYKSTGQCFRKCDNSLDCDFEYSCDTKKTHVCVKDPECTEDQFCQQRLHDLRAVCDAGTCAVGCKTDQDCNQNFEGGFMLVCNQDKHVCEDYGCRDDSDCWSTDIRMFCVANPEPASVTMVQSAITD